MDHLFSEKLWIVPWSLLALGALAVAVIYVVVDTGGAATGLRWVILRWFHPLCWLCLALAALAMARITPLPAAWAAALALAGGALYAAFAVVWLLGKG